MAVQKYKPSTPPRFLDINLANVASKREAIIQWSRNVISRSKLLLSRSQRAIETTEELMAEIGYAASPPGSSSQESDAGHRTTHPRRLLRLMAEQRNAADNRRNSQRRSQDFADRAHQEARDARRRQTNREDVFAQTAINFLNTEAATGLNLAQIATRADNGEQRARNRLHARQAYDTVLKYVGTAGHASRETWDELQQKMSRLRELLVSLGEPL